MGLLSGQSVLCSSLRGRRKSPPIPYEDIIDTKRALTKRTLHEGYGHAPNLALGARVSLAIEGHRLQG